MDNQRELLLFRVERDIAELLLTKMQDSEIGMERAARIAKFVMSRLPDGLVDDQVIKIIPLLDDEFFELADVVHKYYMEEESRQKEVVLDRVRNLSSQKKFGQATKLMTDYLKNKLNDD